MYWFRNTKKNTDNDSEDSKKNDDTDNNYKKTDELQIENNTVNGHDTLSSKLELVQQEYHKIVHELMTSKKEFNRIICFCFCIIQFIIVFFNLFFNMN